MICKKCNLEKPKEDFYKAKNTKSGYRGSCIPCTNAQNNQWYSENAEDFNATTRKAYREEHREESTERMRRWREKNPERSASASRQQYLRNREDILERSRKNHKSKPGYSGWKSSRRRARIKEAGGSFSYQELTNLFEFYGWRCLNPDCTRVDDRLTPDHVVPLFRGGSNFIDNIQPLCLTCNLQKGIKIIDFRS